MSRNRVGRRQSLQLRCLVSLGAVFVFSSSAAADPAAKQPTKATPVSVVGSQVLDMVVAVADDEPISSSELRRFMSQQGKTPPADLFAAPSAEVRRALQEIVIDRLMRKEAEEAGIRVGEEEINSYVAEIKRQNQVDDQGLEQMLLQQGTTLEDYRKQVAGDITRARIVSSKVRSRVNITDEDIAKYVAENPQKTPDAGEYRIEQVLVRLGEGTAREAAQARAAELRKSAASGKALSELAGKDYLDLGFVAPGDLNEELQEAASNTAPGSVSEVFETPNGFQFLKVSASGANAGALDDSTRERIKRQLFEVRMKEQLDKFLNQELLAKYHVEYKL